MPTLAGSCHVCAECAAQRSASETYGVEGRANQVTTCNVNIKRLTVTRKVLDETLAVAQLVAKCSAKMEYED